uniref:Pyrin domain-containing protein n=1 Tax=Pelusios castaneus TaxID=367368 RepID=A0A8C8SDY1_9SAUR
MAKTLSDHLLKTLEELGDDELKRFKYKLREIPLKEGYENIGLGTLKRVDPIELSEKLISYYQADYAVEVTVETLKAINQRDLAEKLAKATGYSKWQTLEKSAPIPQYSSILDLLLFLTSCCLQNFELLSSPHLTCRFLSF